jgi:hypothetical protein
MINDVALGIKCLFASENVTGKISTELPLPTTFGDD